MGFWWGLMIGLFVGASLGLVVAGLCACASRGDKQLDTMEDQ